MVLLVVLVDAFGGGVLLAVPTRVIAIINLKFMMLHIFGSRQMIAKD